MINRKVLSVLVLGSAVLAGCSSSPSEQVYDRMEEMAEVRQTLQEQYEEREQEKREDEVDLLPDWIVEPPAADATGMYGVGIAESKRLSHALKLARLQAEFQLAKMYRQELSGSERAFEQGDSDGNVTTQSTFLIDKLVDSVPVVGYEVVEQVIEPSRGMHNVFILVKLPYDEFNKVLQQEKAKTVDKKVQASFDDLERRLDKRRTQKMEEKQVEFEQEQEAMKNRADILAHDTDSDGQQTHTPSVPFVN